MRTDTQLRIDGIQVLINTFGSVEAERFISLIIREPFDYTRWQRLLWHDRSVKEISRAAMEYRRSQLKKEP